MSEISHKIEDSLEETWNINGAKYNRPTIMKKIIDWVCDGNPLKMFCDQPGAPSMGTVYKWFRNYPEFEEDFRLSEEAGGHSLAGLDDCNVCHRTRRSSCCQVKI